MTLKKLILKPGVDRENTRYVNEGKWYSCDKIRFRQGTPEKIGGWERISAETYLGVCRLLVQWATLGGEIFIGVGTHLKFYISNGGDYYDITPIRSSVTLNNPFDTVNGDATVTVHDTAHGAITGDFVTFSGAAAVGGLTLNNEYQVTVIDVDTYTIEASSNATSTVTGGGGATVSAAYQINTGLDVEGALSGWGGGAWELGTWGVGGTSTTAIRVWSAGNFGESLVFGPRGGAVYYWDASSGLGSRGVEISTLPGASDTPTIQNYLLVSDINRFVLAFGANPIGSVQQDGMLVRWSDQEDVANWSPGATSQAGDLRLSRGSVIVAAIQTRQEVVTITDSAVYSIQYVGAPDFWAAQLLGDNISIASDRAAATASNVVYWMGIDKFYMYDGRVQTLNCDLRQYVFGGINASQNDQIFSGTVEAFNEVWWFYCSADSSTVDRYVVYNYVENGWYYGTLTRTAWVDSVFGQYPIAADPTNSNLLYHEIGTDDVSTGTPVAIESYIESAEFDIDDGDRFGFVWRILPDVTFRGSSAASPSVIMTLKPLQNSGSGYNDPLSVGGQSSRTVTRTATIPVEAFTGQVNIRVRGRQMVMRVASTDLGVQWQLGAPRIDVKADGRR